MWAQLEVKKLYVEHVIIPVNQERQTKQNFNLKTLITVCTSRFVPYSKRCLIHTHRYELKWIRAKYERVANSDALRSVSQVYAIGHMGLSVLIKIQSLKSASQLYTLD